jgi:hypothetical protein
MWCPAQELVGMGLNRETAVSVVNELLGACRGLDGHSFELSAPSVGEVGYQIIIKGVLDQATKRGIQEILGKHQLSSQVGSFWKTKYSPNKTEPDTLIIYQKQS